MLGAIFVTDAVLQLGYTHLITTPVAPTVIFSFEKNGFQTLSQAFYDEPGELYSLTPEELAKHAPLLRQFKNGVKPSVRLMIKDVRLRSPLDKR